MENGTQMTLDQRMPEASPTPIVGASVSHAKTSPLQESNSDLLETARRSFSELCTWLDNSKKKKDPLTCSLRTLKICLVLMEDGISPDFSLKWIGGGYDAEWQVLDSKDFGVPQSRERVFIIGHFRGRSTKQVFPFGRATENSKDDPRIRIVGRALYSNGSGGQRTPVIDINGICPTLTATGYKEPIRIWKLGKIRSLTPKECFRLQGWTDNYFAKAQLVNSDSQLYKQAGNGVTVNVIEAIARRMSNESTNN